MWRHTGGAAPPRRQQWKIAAAAPKAALAAALAHAAAVAAAAPCAGLLGCDAGADDSRGRPVLTAAAAAAAAATVQGGCEFREADRESPLLSYVYVPPGSRRVRPSQCLLRALHYLSSCSLPAAAFGNVDRIEGALIDDLSPLLGLALPLAAAISRPGLGAPLGGAAVEPSIGWRQH